MAVVTRPMTHDDVPAVSEILAACFRQLETPLGWTPEQMQGLLRECAAPQPVRKRLPAYDAFVAEVDGQVVGYVASEGNEIQELFVHPEHQRRGVGRALFDLAADQIRAAGHKELRVGTATNSQGFYTRMGAREHERYALDRGPLRGCQRTVFSKRLQS